MKERPIIFSGEMVRAILEGRKTMTRRVIKPETLERFINLIWNPNENLSLCPYGQPGDRLWVREPAYIHNPPNEHEPNGCIYYVADIGLGGAGCPPPSIFLPRWASRITLEIVSVRVERIQDITKGTQAEVIHRIEAEGVTCKNYTGTPYCTNCSGHEAPCHVEQFQRTWNSANAKNGYGWDANPWVWVIEFKMAQGGER